MQKPKPEWSKTYPVRPRDNLLSHEKLKAPKFMVSYEKDPCPSPMSLLLGWEYARIWQRERDAYQTEQRLKNAPKRIKNDFDWWLKKRTVKVKRVC